MPIYADPDRRNERPPALTGDPPDAFPALVYRPSEESIRTEFCEGPVPDENLSEMAHGHQSSDRLDPKELPEGERVTYDRAELIERIKRGETQRWLPKQQEHSEQASEGPNGESDAEPSLRCRPSQSLLPAIELKGPIPSGQDVALCNEVHAPNLEVGLAIYRPRSALHSGNFTEGINPTQTASEHSLITSPTMQQPMQPVSRIEASLGQSQTQSQPIPTQNRVSSFSNFSRPMLRPSWTPAPQVQPLATSPQPQRLRAPSLQAQSSFSFRSPTSPLVQQSSYNDDDGLSSLRVDRSQETRRKTLPSEVFQNMRSLPSTLAQAARQPSSFQHDVNFSYQSREARRSATFGSPLLASVSPPTPNFLRFRRSSFSSEASSLQPSSMVGSYEESILRGRMSSMPSKPVEFTAQIGALGKGNCKPKHPAHASLTFPAVFYNWTPVDMPTVTDPSPYVGQIDIEHGLPPPQKKQKKSRDLETMKTAQQDLAEEAAQSAAEREKQRGRRRSPLTSMMLMGGCYRIPQCGQLQILIKNPNKTAVKLFLIPYDLADMEPGTKTFIRQNCYTAGPIIEKALTSKAPSGTATSNGTRSVGAPEKPKLRYSAHLHICCPAQGRFYLYKEIKVVFANRVPDNKEKLRSEIRLPEPRYSPYKPLSEATHSPSSNGARRILENQRRRRSYQTAPTIENREPPELRRGVSFSSTADSFAPPVPAIPSLDRLTVGSSQSSQSRDNKAWTDETSETEQRPRSSGLQSQLAERLSKTGSNFSGSVRSSSSNDSSSSSYSKLNRGDVGYGGLFARPGTPEAGESLLSRKLRRLEEDSSKQ